MNKLYCSTYCNKAHRVSDGKPVGHECRVLPVAALHAEIEGDFERAVEIMRTDRPKYHRGVKA